MPATFRRLLAAGVLAAMPMALQAQAAPTAAPDSIAYPRQFVKWVLSAQGDSAFNYAGPQLRESMKSAADVNQMAIRVVARFGELKSTDAEVQFDEGPLKVYIAAMTFSTAPEPGAWVVVYSPATKIVERASFGSLANAKSKYPQAKLP